jgi:hypothetical protein
LLAGSELADESVTVRDVEFRIWKVEPRVASMK